MDNLTTILAKHLDFWNRSPTAVPLIQRIGFTGGQLKPYPVKDGKDLVQPTLINPADIDIDRLLALDRPPFPVNEGYRIHALGCRFSEAWMEALVGCPLRASAYSCTAGPAPSQAFQLQAAQNSPWARVMTFLLATAQQAAGRRIAVRLPHLRGIVDILAAYLGEEQFCLAFYDNPRLMEQLAAGFAALFTTTINRCFKIVKLWQGGYVSPWGLFAPGRLLDYQADASNLISPQQYTDHLLKFDQAIIHQFPFSLFHVHACGLHIIDSLLKIQNLKAIEISLDRETGACILDHIVRHCRKIQENHKSVLIYGQLDETELRQMKNQLNPAGLAIFYW